MVKRKPYFGRIFDGNVLLSKFGQIVQGEWLKTSQIRPGIDLDEFIVMPDHFHAIGFFNEPDMISVGAVHELPLLELLPTAGMLPHLLISL